MAKEKKTKTFLEYEGDRVRGIMEAHGVANIMKALEGPITDKKLVLDALEELENITDEISSNLQPPFETEAWGRWQTIREAVQDAQKYFEKLEA